MLRPVESEIPQHSSSSSPALKEIVAYLEGNDRTSILDLGPASSANVGFFEQWSPKIYIEDFYNSLALVCDYGPPLEPVFCPVYETLLSCTKDTQFDIILAWDLFDYLHNSDISRLIAYLDALCHSGTLLFALISIRPRIPDRPAKFWVRDREHLCWQNESDAMMPCRRFTQRALLELLPNFRMKRSFLMRNGIQEYLFMRS